MDDAIKELGQRLLNLEDALANAAAGHFEAIELQHDDALAGVEVGVNTLVEDLRQELEKTAAHSRELEAKVQARTRELQQQLEHITEQAELIRRQRDEIRELSTPVLQLREQVIVMPIVGSIDAARGAEMSERLLAAIAERQVRYAILDVTGVTEVDTNSVAHLVRIVRAAGLLGAKCVLTGIRPAVAQVMVALGIDLGAVAIQHDLAGGLELCLSAMKGHRR